jgi:hypothetical protein
MIWSNPMSDLYTFDPTLLSKNENEFLLNALGEPTIVALRNIPRDVNAKAVRPILDRVNELQELEKHEDQKWVGVAALKKAITVWLQQNDKWASDHRRNRRAPRWPSLYSYDAKGTPRRSGPGSDSGRVKTYFGPSGERIPFEVQLIPENIAEWVAPGFTEQTQEKNLFIDTEKNRIECRVPLSEGGVCGHTESYRSDSRASYSAARARMSKHLRKPGAEVDLHRELYTNEFGA